jgi:hypothetical protein
MIANQTTEFAPDSLLGNQFELAVSSFALRTSEVGFSHVRNRTMVSLDRTFVGHAPGLAGRLNAFDPTGWTDYDAARSI